MPKHIPNLENDSYMHVTTLIREDYLGTLSYFLLNVTAPPPELLLDDCTAYRSQLRSASGIAAFDSMMWGGAPLCQWQLAFRSEDGPKCVKLRALEYHKVSSLHPACTQVATHIPMQSCTHGLPMTPCTGALQMRGFAHKPLEARVMILALLATESTHPKIATIARDHAFFNWLGRDASSVARDKAIEMLHRSQQERTAKWTQFERALHHSPEMVGMMHAQHALDVAEHGESGAIDPLRQSALNAAEAVRADMLSSLGTDLTIPDDRNHLFHTGGSPNTVRSHSSVSHRPVEYMWRVADATSAGPGRSKLESWERHTDRFLQNHLWF